MSKLSQFDTENVTDIQGDKDVLGGGGVFDSDAYEFRIETAFLTVSKTGATGVQMDMVDVASERHFRPTIYITSGTAKGGKPFFINSNGEKQFLPGFNNINAIAKLATGQLFGKLNTEEKTIGVYDYDEKKEVPTKVDMIMDLLGKTIVLGLHKEIVDKNKLNPATKKYEPTGETREQNEIKKVFQPKTHLTMTELDAGETEGAFYDQWVAKWKGEVINKAEGAKATGATSGAPAAGGAAAGNTDNLFD